MIKNRSFSLFLILLVPVFCLFAIVSPAFAFNNIVAFGDSLTDNGDADGYGYGLYCEAGGKAWVEYLAESYGCPLLDMAYGGATTGDTEPNLQWQIDQYLNVVLDNPTIGAETFVIVWAGCNDLWKEADPQDVPGVARLETGIATLINAGARQILINNLPDIGEMPGAQEVGSIYAVLGTYYSTKFNRNLAALLTAFVAAHDTVDFYYFDVFSLFRDIVANPAGYGFDNATGMLADALPTDDIYLYYDQVHPSDAGNRILAEYAANEALTAPLASGSQIACRNFWFP